MIGRPVILMMQPVLPIGAALRRAGVALLALVGLALTAATACAQDRPAAAREAERGTLRVGGENRRYLTVVPAGAARPGPVVIALHGAGQSPESFRAYFGLDAAARGHGFAAVYPEGLGRVWNDGRPAAMRLKAVLRPGDDVPFLLALADRLVADGIADPARIYLTGISNGGFMVERMACEHADRFAAFSAIMATAPANYRSECQPGRPVPFLFIHGTADAVVAYDGFWTPVGATLSAPDSAGLFAELNGCTGTSRRALPDLDPSDGTTVEETRWTGCREDAPVVLLSVARGGHQPPARVDTKPDLATPFLGLRNRDIDSGEEVWAFMSPFSLGGAVAAPGQPAARTPAAPRAVPLPAPSPLRIQRAQERGAVAQ